ncbi:DUF350 domain-containing protein [Methyloraptor flagellatus]|uniref:DUF350 domain-containing protein n=1 Tax=Methyloraptor flagellatus TaxID=3162530 RepID=A0AAU7XGX1_9HYPH
MDFAHLTESLQGFGPFLLYVGLSLGLIAIYAAVYTWTTAHDELALIRDGNFSAAVAFSGSLIGYTLPIAALILNTRTVLEFLMWGVIALVVQVGIYWFFRLLMIRDVSARITRNEAATGTLLAAASLVGGIVNAAALAT